LARPELRVPLGKAFYLDFGAIVEFFDFALISVPIQGFNVEIGVDGNTYSRDAVKEPGPQRNPHLIHPPSFSLKSAVPCGDYLCVEATARSPLTAGRGK
jgi:hypothetical protein